MAPTSEPRSKHFYWIDWLRFIAALMVVAYHARLDTWKDLGGLAPEDRTLPVRALFLATRAGLEWVVVFFVVSGFLVGGKVIERCFSKRFDPLDYAIDRTTRLWVPLIPALALTAAVGLFYGQPPAFFEFVGNLFGLQGILCQVFDHNEPLWTLSYETWFYILAGVTGMISTRQGNRLLLLLGLALCLVVFTKLDSYLLGCWLLGAFSYLLVRENDNLAIGLVGLLVMLLGAFLSQTHLNTAGIGADAYAAWIPSRSVSLLIQSAGAGLLLANLAKRMPTSVWAMRIEPLGTWLAGFSYTLYLTQYPILGFLHYFFPAKQARFNGATLSIYVAKLFICLVVAWLLSLVFESRTAQVREICRKSFKPASCLRSAPAVST